MKRPVLVSRFVQLPLTGFWTCERSRTAPRRALSPVGAFLAMAFSSGLLIQTVLLHEEVL